MDDGLRLLLAGAVPFALRLRREFRGLLVREGVVVRGPEGWGEFAPFDDYSDMAAGRWLASAIESAYGGLPAAVRDAVQANAIIAGSDPVACAEQVRHAVTHLGCATVKVQVGSPGLADDVARIGAVRAALDDVRGDADGSIRIDAKGRWGPDAAVVAMHALEEFGIEYVEQPCATGDELRSLRGRVSLPVAVDETIRLAADLSEVDVRGLADIAIVKPAPLGGAAATLALAARLGLPVVVSGSLDSSVGLGTSIRAAGALERLELACGLGTGALLLDDLCSPTTVPERGQVRVGAREPDPALLELARERVEPGRRAYWADRLARAWQALPPGFRERVVA